MVNPYAVDPETQDEDEASWDDPADVAAVNSLLDEAAAQQADFEANGCQECGGRTDCPMDKFCLPCMTLDATL